MTQPKHNLNSSLLLNRNRSSSSNTLGEKIWLKRKNRGNHTRSKSLTDEDFVELKACIELGFGFDSPNLESDQRLSKTLPALGFYVAVNKCYNDAVSRSSDSDSSSSDSDSSSSGSPDLSPLTVFTPGDDPKTIKTRLYSGLRLLHVPSDNHNSSHRIS